MYFCMHSRHRWGGRKNLIFFSLSGCLRPTDCLSACTHTHTFTHTLDSKQPACNPVRPVVHRQRRCCRRRCHVSDYVECMRRIGGGGCVCVCVLLCRTYLRLIVYVQFVRSYYTNVYVCTRAFFCVWFEPRSCCGYNVRLLTNKRVYFTLLA